MLLFETDVRREIGQVKESACTDDRQQPIRIQGEEPYPWNSLQVHIRADVDFVKMADARQRRCESRSRMAYREWSNSDPGLAVECIDCQAFGNMIAQCFGGYLPVQEQQLVPCLIHNG